MASVEPAVLDLGFRQTRSARNTGHFAGPREEMAAVLRVAGIGTEIANILSDMNEARVAQAAVMYDDVIGFSEWCADRRVGVTLLSNCGPGASGAFSATGAWTVFDHVLLSFAIRCRKPSTESYQIARETNGAEHIIFVDDNPAFCLAGVESGFECFQITRELRDSEHVPISSIKQIKSLDELQRAIEPKIR
jgi:FMN phosphatase YigB (HAD superfamily)